MWYWLGSMKTGHLRSLQFHCQVWLTMGFDCSNPKAMPKFPASSNSRLPLKQDRRESLCNVYFRGIWRGHWTRQSLPPQAGCPRKAHTTRRRRCRPQTSDCNVTFQFYCFPNARGMFLFAFFLFLQFSYSLSTKACWMYWGIDSLSFNKSGPDTWPGVLFG